MTRETENTALLALAVGMLLAAISANMLLARSQGLKEQRIEARCAPPENRAPEEGH